jgi:WD40 repeat protein
MDLRRVTASLLASSIVIAGAISPASADPVDITPTSSFEWLDGHATDVEFDPSGRLWVWNISYDTNLPHGQQTNVFTKNANGNWDHAFRFRAKGVPVGDVSFSSDGTVFIPNGYRCKLSVITLKANGKVKKHKVVKFKGRFCPYMAQPIDGGQIAVAGSDKVNFYRLPITSRSKPVRTLVPTHTNNLTDMLVGPDGSVYVAYGNVVTQGVDVYLPSQSGMTLPNNSFSIASDYSPVDIYGMSMTPSESLALKMESTVAIFPTNTNGSDQVPSLFYRFGTPSYLGGDLEFDSTGRMAVAEWGYSPPVRVFFEAPPCAPRPEARC